MAKRRVPRLRLWHCFALVALAAILIWLWPKVGIEVDHKPGTGSRAAVLWQGNEFELWDTFPTPPVYGFSPTITYDENGITGIEMN